MKQLCFTAGSCFFLVSVVKFAVFFVQQYIYDDPNRWNFSFNYYVLLTRAAMHTRKVVSWVFPSIWHFLLIPVVKHIISFYSAFNLID